MCSEGSYNFMCQTREKLGDPRTDVNLGCLPATVSVLIPEQSGRMFFMSITKSMEKKGTHTPPHPDFLLQVMTCIKKISFLCFTLNS